jgi:hypothetical protein
MKRFIEMCRAVYSIGALYSRNRISSFPDDEECTSAKRAAYAEAKGADHFNAALNALIVLLICLAMLPSLSLGAIVSGGGSIQLGTNAIVYAGGRYGDDPKFFNDQDALSSSASLGSGVSINECDGSLCVNASGVGGADQSVNLLINDSYSVFNVSGRSQAAADNFSSYFGSSEGHGLSRFEVYFLLTSPYSYTISSNVLGDSQDFVDIYLGGNAYAYQHAGQGGLVPEISGASGLLSPGSYWLRGYTSCSVRAESPDGATHSSCDNNFSFELQLTAVPIPATAWLFSSGLLGLIGIAQKRRLAARVGANSAA